MGSVGSILSNHGHTPVQRPERKSVRERFGEEFGNVLKEDEPKTIDLNEDGAENVGGSSMSRKKTVFVANGNTFRLIPAVFRAKRLFLKPIAKIRPIKDTALLVKTQNSHTLLEEIYNRMDHTSNVISSMMSVGEVELVAKYNAEGMILLVKVGRARNLSKEDTFGLPDPYAVVDIFSTSNPEDVVTRKTKVQSNTCDPSFEEILTFPVNQKSISHTKLRLTMWDKDNFSADDFLGECLVDICKLDLNYGSRLWYQLYPKIDSSFCGNLEISLQFSAPKSLFLTIIRANGVKVCDDVNKSSNPYVRVFVTGLPDKYETKVDAGVVDPMWNESFEFDVYPSEFSRRLIVMNVLSKNYVGNRDKRLGDVHVPLNGLMTNGDRVFSEHPLQDLKNTSFSRSKWAGEGLSIEFHEAMRAHMIYGYPKFLFKKHQNVKNVVSCRSEKALTQAKMIINNGILTKEDVFSG